MLSAENSFALFFCIKTTEVSCFFSRVNSLYSMEEILRALGMGTLVERFQAQRVEPETVLAASDNELVRLGHSHFRKCQQQVFEGKSVDTDVRLYV